jgi:Uma2 family endonuclease
MSLALKYPPRYTIRDYERWEGDWELIEGVPYALASPTPLHQRVGALLVYLLEGLLEDCNDCFVLYETDWFISDFTVVRPDLMVICGELKERIEEPPKAVIEIVSPTSAERDEKLKFELYEREGVDYYILVYPERKKLKVYKRTPKGFALEKEKIDLEGCEIEIEQLKRVFEKL